MADPRRDAAAVPAPTFLRFTGGDAWSGDRDSARRRLLEIADMAALDLAHARRLEMLHSGDEHFDRLVAAIEGAEREICLEMYQIRPDPVGWRVASALTRAAARGVEVRLLLDRFGSSGVANWLEAFSAHGVAVRWYNPWRPWANPFHRTHRKLVVVDGHLASVGGINLAAEFSEALAGDRAWRDVGLWLEGPAAWCLRRQFDRSWEANGGSPGRPVLVPDGSGTLCALAAPRPGRANQAAAYRALASTARRELLLATPYFLPDRTFRRQLVAAAHRGVAVTVVVPRHSDIWWFKHGARRRYQELMRAGIAVWERCDRMVHAKVAVADGMVAAVGSTNLNRLSFHGNSETLLLTTEPRVVEQLRTLIAVESREVAERLCDRSWPAHPDRRPWAELAATVAAALL
jgi:cardiolipin synthase